MTTCSHTVYIYIYIIYAKIHFVHTYMYEGTNDGNLFLFFYYLFFKYLEVLVVGYPFGIHHLVLCFL